MRKIFTDKSIAALKPRTKRYVETVPQLSNFYIRVYPSGQKTYFVVPRDPDGKQVEFTLGSAAVLKFEEAIERARQAVKRVEAGLPPVEPKKATFEAVINEFFARHVEKKELVTKLEIERRLNKYVMPHWRNKEFISIEREDVAQLLDRIEDNHGPRQADLVLSDVRKAMRWHATRTSKYHPPIVAGMARQSAAKQARSRIFTLEELAKVWAACRGSGVFGAFVQIALLTGQRRDKIADMRWDDLKGDVWEIRIENDREKGHGGVLVLPPLAVDIIDALPRLQGNPHVFAASRGSGPINGFSKMKIRLDKLSGVTGWVLHDLRRTARSLMSRAGIASEVAELVLGHQKEGVEGVYDRHTYDSEKRIALAKLAALVDGVVNPRPDNVVSLESGARSRRPT